ncbi:cystathionine beta-lyase [Cricetibacter osteomyelitidis]|uniref:cysteine-S-conjugate beta-lyase n=1 Tax=Cricetibacter osteomyelitidis TaxID=1521931 RepID=A0A4R2SUG1_9PAST|nr:MalY/PatB family protein [Cricetibacter osteomyelitidis]TCP92126.1 cystathionine beta-lyase [Cricetibacter osteomyelitidis]
MLQPSCIFDQIIDRTNTLSAKWDSQNRYGVNDLTPLSVADMDFSAPPQLVEYLHKQNKLGIYGYSILPNDYYQTIQQYLLRHYQYQTDYEDIVFCPRIIQAVSIYIQYFTKKKDSVCILTPSYSPIFNSITLNNRQVEKCELIYKNKQYHIDFERLAQCFQAAKTFILISPHNPTGTVWSKENLRKISMLAEKYQVFIISDDVHADFDFSGQPHLFISDGSDYVRNHSIICTSPAKSFNIPGLEIANLIIHNSSVRQKFQQIMLQLGMHNPNFFGVHAIEFAYKNCDLWLENLKHYIQGNKAFVRDFFTQALPQLEVTQSAGTYLLWINYEKLNISEEKLKQCLLHQAKVEMSWGSDFGEVRCFFRMNIALPRSQLKDCLVRIKEGLILYQQEG